MPFAEHDNMVKTIPSDRADEPLRIAVLPWRPWRDRSIPYTHCSKPPDDDVAIDAITIANDILWRLLPAVGFGQLTGNPMGARACGHTQPQKLAAGMLQDQKSIQQPKRDRRDYEQIHRRNAVGVIAQKGLPALRRWPPSPRHVFCHGGLPDIDAKLEQWIRGAPQSGFAPLIQSPFLYSANGRCGQQNACCQAVFSGPTRANG
jgi:hypothetical protein